MIDEYIILTKKYFWSIFGVIGVVAFWAGIWEGIAGLPYLEHYYYSLIAGLALLLFSGIFNKEFDPAKETERAVHRIIHKIKNHPHKHHFHLRYHDHLKNKSMTIRASNLRGVEKGGFVILSNKKIGELFLPIHRIKEILYRGKTYWKE